MSSLKKKYDIKDGDATYSLTAKQLYERVMKDSESDYGWIAPVKELTRICRDDSFPVEYALPIKIAILNCYANIEHRANSGGDLYASDPEDEEAVEYCYNSLYGINSDEVVKARDYYLTEMISRSSYVHGVYDSLYHPGPTFKKLREEWKRSKFEEYTSCEKIDFKQLIETLYSDFYKSVKTAEANGDFKEDEEEDVKKWEDFCRRMNGRIIVTN